MPTYEYECRSCKHRFEEFQSINDDPIRNCPKCGKSVRQLFGGGMGIIFKGSGFYQTDYRSKDYVRRAKEEKKTPSSASGSKEKKTAKAK